MIAYEPKNWLSLTFHVTGTVIPQIRSRILALLFVTGLLLLAKKEWPAVESFLAHCKPFGHTLIGVALGMAIVFRTNASYDRYWEGRKLWGTIVNTSRNLIRGSVVHVAECRDLANLVGAYALALKQHLRGKQDLSEIEELVSPEIYRQACASANPPSMIALHMSRWIQQRQAEGKLDVITAQGLEMQVRIFLDCQGACERIRRTPMPYVYAVHINQLVMLYLVTLPLVLVSDMGTTALIIVPVIAFGLLGIEEAGVEIEDPFGEDPNDLPIEGICGTISRDSMALAEADKR